MRTDRSRTLVIGVSWLGDTVMSLPALGALRRTFPDEFIHIGSTSGLANLISLAAPVDGVLRWPVKGSLFARVRQINAGRYDRIIIFPNSFRSALVAWLSGVPERWGYAGQHRGWLLKPAIPQAARHKRVHQSQHYLDLVRQLGWNGSELPEVRIKIPRSASLWVESVLESPGYSGRIVGICPGATYGPAKRWAPERFVKVAKTLRDRQRVKVLLMGNEKEAPFIHEMAKMIGHGTWDLSGRTDMEKLIALLATCAVVISNDSGPMHLASALGTPVVALFGSTDPMQTAPMGPHRIIQSSLDCSPCLRRTCTENTYQCLQDITTGEVIDAVEDFLVKGKLAKSPVP